MRLRVSRPFATLIYERRGVGVRRLLCDPDIGSHEERWDQPLQRPKDVLITRRYGDAKTALSGARTVWWWEGLFRRVITAKEPVAESRTYVARPKEKRTRDRVDDGTRLLIGW